MRPCMRTVTFKIPLRPTVAPNPIPLGLGWPRKGPFRPGRQPPRVREFGTVQPMLGAIGVLVNGVALNGVASKFSETLQHHMVLAEGDDFWVDAGESEHWMDDHCGGHLSGGGNYHTHIGVHYNHGKREACGLPSEEHHTKNEHAKLLGWAFD